jgi:hypothetical protein
LSPRVRTFLTALVLLLAPVAQAAGPAVSWDADLARPADREDYERRLLAMVQDARARVAAGLGLEPPPTLTVQVHSRAGFERVFGARAGEREAARMAGDVVHVNGGPRLDDRLAGLLVHEMTHATLDARGTAAAVPLWVDEGLADKLSWDLRGQPGPSTGQMAELRQARDRGTLLPLPTAGELTPLQYLASWAVVVYLEARFGHEKVLAAVRAALAGETFEKALRRETGMSPDEAERAFEKWVGTR